MRHLLLVLTLLLAPIANADPYDYSKGTCLATARSADGLFHPAINYTRATNDTWEECHGTGWWAMTPAEIDALVAAIEQASNEGGSRQLTEEERNAIVLMFLVIIGTAGVYRYVIAVLRNQR